MYIYFPIRKNLIINLLGQRNHSIYQFLLVLNIDYTKCSQLIIIWYTVDMVCVVFLLNLPPEMLFQKVGADTQ